MKFNKYFFVSLFVLLLIQNVISERMDNDLSYVQISWNNMINKSETFIKSMTYGYRKQFELLDKSVISGMCNLSIWKTFEALDNSELWAFSSNYFNNST